MTESTNPMKAYKATTKSIISEVREFYVCEQSFEAAVRVAEENKEDGCRLESVELIGECFYSKMRISNT